MNGALYSRADVDRLYVTQEEEGRGWVSVEELVRVEEHSQLEYLKKTEVNSDRILDLFVKEKKKQKLITEQ